ncbi:ABC transporter permease subunit [Pilimelia columellifera]|uniref:ABC transporter n=1 Tax=Pilimelia columellifera subsp. columellifera TaxID=706583 RepID=A0ABN3NJB2_9ACTN
MRLAQAELRRLFLRRFTRWMLLIAVLVLSGVAVTAAVSSTPNTPQTQAAAQVQAEQQAREMAEQHRRDVAECEAARARGEDVTQSWPPDCDIYDYSGEVQASWFLPYEFVFRQEFGSYLAVFFGVLTLVAFLVGASFVGAEWSSGAMTNLLLWQPRRLRVLFTKLGVLLAAMTTLTLASGALWTAGFWLVGRFGGRLGELTPGAWRSFGLDGLRGLTFLLLVTVASFAIASIGRHTAAALGAVVGLGMISEVGVRILVESLETPFGERYVLSSYLLAWVQKSYTIVDYFGCPDGAACPERTLVLTWHDSLLVLGVGAGLTVLAAALSMRRRDVA